MDEPLSNLDAKLRVQMRSEIVNIHQNIGATTIYVTHDQTEAMTMADRIVVMNKGYIQQIGTPMEIYKKPANLFVASFIGAPSMNIINVKYSKGVVEFENGFKIAISKEQQKIIKQFYINEIESLKNLIANNEKRIEQIKDEINALHKGNENKVLLAIKKNDAISALIVESETYNHTINGYEQIIKDEECDMKFGVRPEDIVTTDIASLLANKSESFTLNVNFAELLGNEYYIHSLIGKDKVVLEVDTNKKIEKSSVLEVAYNLDNIHLFDPLSTKIIL
jgi:ABC-type sugar transport system ATPase subunit